MLELKNISFTIEEDGQKTEILKNISMKLEDNQFYAMTGPNGGGKSTLAKIIAGIVTPTTGQILLDGVDITEKDITERARLGVGYSFQQPPRFKGLTARDLLRLASGSEIDPKKEDECFGQLLLEVGLCPQDYLDRDVDASLSGGESKRIEIATMLCRKMRMAIYDEPEAGIDLWSFSKLIDIFLEARNRKEGTILVISHQEKILEMADQIVLVVDGEVTHIGQRDEVLPHLLMKGDCDLKCLFRKGSVID